MNTETLWKVLLANLSITPEQYDRAATLAQEVGEWLEGGQGRIREGGPRTFVHGSFALGTAVRPIRDELSYDVDVACELMNADTDNWLQPEVKGAVGDRLKQNDGYRRRLTREGDEEYEKGRRRCWTLEYEDNFHLDVLPAVPDQEVRGGRHRQFIETVHERTALRLTDKNLNPEWPVSNPEGYKRWFEERCGALLRSELARLEEEAAATGLVKRARTWEAQTALQGVTKLLKRHRDFRCGDDEHKPVSIVITTLVGKTFDPAWNLDECMRRIPEAMSRELRETGYEVRNPVDKRENFTDRWVSEPIKKQKFLEWMQQLIRDRDRVTETGLTTIQRIDRMADGWAPSARQALLETGRTEGIIEAPVIAVGSRTGPAIEGSRAGTHPGAKPWRS